MRPPDASTRDPELRDEPDEGIILGESRDEESIPFGTRVKVTLWMQDRHCEESAWFFDITRPDGTR